MTSSHKKPGVAFWATVVVVCLLIAYPLSFGPACWIATRGDSEFGELPSIYTPIGLTRMHRPECVGRAIDGFARIGMRSRSVVDIPIGGQAHTRIKHSQ
jgi:hypothetical protein